MLRHLREHHGWMLALLRDAGGLAGQGQGQCRPSAAFLMARRNAMARLLTSYGECVHRELFLPLIARGTERDAALTRAVKVECIVLAERFRAFQRRWIVEDAVERWDAYLPEALEMAAQLRRHIAGVDAIVRHLTDAAVRQGGV